MLTELSEPGHKTSQRTLKIFTFMLQKYLRIWKIFELRDVTGGCYLVADAAAAGLLPGLPQRAHDVVQVALGVVRTHPHHATSHALKIFYSIKNILFAKIFIKLSIEFAWQRYWHRRAAMKRWSVAKFHCMSKCICAMSLLFRLRHSARRIRLENCGYCKRTSCAPFILYVYIKYINKCPMMSHHNFPHNLIYTHLTLKMLGAC